MNFCRSVHKVFIVLLLAASATDAYSQDVVRKATRQTAVDAFSGGKFENACIQFTELSALYPKDPLYKYYLGACLVELKKESQKASDLLDAAIRESAAIRPVPPEAHFYLGRALQMDGRFAEAIKSYNSFTNSAGKKIAKEMKVPELIRQCEDGKGSIALAPEEKPADKQKDDKPDRQILPMEYDVLLAEALVLQNKSDSAQALASGYRIDMENKEGSERSALWAKAAAHEKLSESYRKESDNKMTEAGRLSGIPDSVPEKTDELEKPVLAETGTDTTSFIKENIEETQVVEKTDSKAIKPEEEILKPVASIPVFSEFNITEKPVYQPDEKVVVNPVVAPGLIYRIQVAVFRNPVAPQYFKGISPVNGFRNETAGITIYFAGLFRKSADAGKALPRVKSLGFKDAFVVALMDKKAVSMERALLLEKEWGTKPLYTREEVKDTIPPTLIFRVEVKRSPKPLPKEQVEEMKKIAGNRGFDILVSESKQTIYLAGSFFTYISASEYADLLIRNGYRDAKVAAYLGSREIPVETARQLFDEQ